MSRPPRGDVRSGSIRAEGCDRFHYTVRGAGAAILFLHGFPASGLLWEEAAKILSDRFTCVCPDLPGWGESTPIKGGGMELLRRNAALLDRLREDFGGQIENFVATDAGAVLAAYYAAVHAKRVKRLVLMSAPLWPDFNIPWPMRILRTPLLGEVASLALKPLMFWRLGLEGRDLEAYTQRLQQAFSKPFRGPLGGWRLARNVRWGNPAEVMAPLSRMLPAIEAKTLVVHCTHDRAVPLSMAKRTAAAIPDAQVLELEGPHFLPMTHPRLTAEFLADFFAGS